MVAPSRGRGSKRLFSNKRSAAVGRPFTGAWIETPMRSRCTPSRTSPLHGGVDRNYSGNSSTPITVCRPFTGAWIETAMRVCCEAKRGVAPSRGRGSKHDNSRGAFGCILSPLHGGVDRNLSFARMSSAVSRRPFTGAWIETHRHGRRLTIQTVAPSRGRGSKHFTLSFRRRYARGRPFTGAWIETFMG